MTKPFSTPKRRRILAEYVAGVKTAAIAAKFGCDATYPRKLAVALDMPPRPRGPKPKPTRQS